MVAMGSRSPLQYVVLFCQTGKAIYTGPSMDAVAEYLEPGTVYGSGRTRKEALEQAQRRATHAQRAKRLSASLWTPVHTPGPPAEADDPSLESIAQACKEIREQGYTDKRGNQWRTWGGRRWIYENR
jgi:hypothetical protein